MGNQNLFGNFESKKLLGAGSIPIPFLPKITCHLFFGKKGKFIGEFFIGMPEKQDLKHGLATSRGGFCLRAKRGKGFRDLGKSIFSPNVQKRDPQPPPSKKGGEGSVKGKGLIKKGAFATSLGSRGGFPRSPLPPPRGALGEKSPACQ
ncbi:MAG: hypothetical protein CM15mP71_3480 [Candidatus Poseidoniales archaeon]|nr:MAG: hypothetical protein CM15mP71_3480 [Candidatus Poseidoniales archaeon]